MSNRACRFAFPLLFLGLASACFSLKRDYPQKSYFVLDARRAERVEPEPGAPTLQVRRLDVSPGYEAVGFVYRVGENEFESDYYNEFFVPPLSLVTRELQRWVAASGLFGVVVGSGTNLLPEYVLDGSVRSLHADLRDPEAPRAVIELQLFLILVRGNEMIYNGSYRAEPIAAGPTAAELAAGWDEALRQILTEAEADLREVLAEAAGR